MTTDIPREPSEYYLSTHAKQQRRHRDIDLDLVKQTIQTGEIKQSHKDNCVLFIKDFAFTEYPIGIVADYVDGEIITVEYRK